VTAVEPPAERAGLRRRVEDALAAFLARQHPRLLAMTPDLEPMIGTVERFVAGGKRLRPAFCYWGWRAVGGVDSDAIIAAASSLELLQASALVHDDVMDASDTRRGQPSVHRQFAVRHAAAGWNGDSDAFGQGVAILVGDLCLSWADEMLFGSGLPEGALAAARPLWGELHTELMAGQFLDLLEQARGGTDVARVRRVMRFKSAKYTVERPLHLGATLAGAGRDRLAVFTGYGLPLGEAFQMRDDVLGVFGDPAETGKPAGDDLREGKVTALVVIARERARGAGAAVLERIGDPALDDAGLTTLREVIVDTGALADVEKLIATRTAEALSALDGAALDPEATAVLVELATAAVTRRT
jgi:geranylgeranyl diphosphate synthase, type I